MKSTATIYENGFTIQHFNAAAARVPRKRTSPAVDTSWRDALRRVLYGITLSMCIVAGMIVRSERH